MSNKFIGQGKWVRDILKKLGNLQEQQPKPFDRDPEWPEWVDNLLTMLLGISYPGSRFKNIKKWKAKDLGRFLGRHYACEYLKLGQVPLSPQVMRESVKSEAWAATWLKQKHPEFDMAKFAKEYEPQSKAWKLVFTNFIKETLASACERPYREASAFFEAYGKGIVIKPDELESERTLGVGDKICWTMFVMWQDIERFESVAQLHRIFERALKPHGIVVKYKRIEKLCQRIKLKFKGRGRPSGSKIQTNPPSV